VVAGLLPGTGGVITGATGTVGGVSGGVRNTVTGVVDQTLGGVIGGGGGLLPDDVLNALLGTLLANSSTVPGAANSIVLSGGQLGPGGTILLDASAPRSTVTVLSKLTQVDAPSADIAPGAPQPTARGRYPSIGWADNSCWTQTIRHTAAAGRHAEAGEGRP
jgi:hypothetical protein